MKNKKEWTVMIYMAGDNNLSVDMAYSLDELRKSFLNKQNDKVNLFVYYDNAAPDFPPLYCDFTDPEFPVYEYGDVVGNESAVIAGNDHVPAVDSVVDFADWCVNRVGYVAGNIYQNGRRANNHALIFSGHTMGFIKMGLLKDENPRNRLSLSALEGGLKKINEDIIGKKLDILGFDSCVMSMFEVGHQFRDSAVTMIASEGSIPNAGWSYADIIENLTDFEGDSELFEMTDRFVRSYIEKQARYSIGGVAVDMAAWKLTKLDSLNGEIESLAGNLLECFENTESSVYRQLKRVLLQTHWNAQSYMFDQNIDLGDFCSLLSAELDCLKKDLGRDLDQATEAVGKSCRAILREIDKCIIVSGFSGGTYQFSTGISLFFPWSLAAYQAARNDYSELSFVQHTSAGRLWQRFLEKYLGQVSRRAARKPTEVSILNTVGIPEAKTIQSVAYAQRYPMNPLARIPDQSVAGAQRYPMNPLARMPNQSVAGAQRYPMNPLARMVSDSGHFFENISKFKNVESRWDILGYTRTVQTVSDDT